MKTEDNLINKPSLKEILIFFIIIPLFLTLIFTSSLNREFALFTAKPSILTIYFSNFAHANYGHFKGNIISYIILLFFVYLINIFLNIRSEKKFNYDMLFIFLVVPLIVSLFNIWLYPNDDSTAFLGFSGIVSALAGYLAALFVVFIYEKANLNATNLYAFVSVIFFNLTILVLFIYHISVDLVLLVIILTFISLIFIKNDVLNILSVLKDYATKFSNTKQYYIFYFLLFLIFIYIVFVIVTFWIQLFPLTIISETGRVNIVGHYLGYCIGILTPWSIHNIERLILYLKIKIDYYSDLYLEKL